MSLGRSISRRISTPAGRLHGFYRQFLLGKLDHDEKLDLGGEHTFVRQRVEHSVRVSYRTGDAAHMRSAGCD